MSTAHRIAKIVEPHGFVRHEEPGFEGWHRIHPGDGRKQLLHVFFWSNAGHAAAAGIPHAYVVVVPTIDSRTLPGESGYVRHEDARFIITTKDRQGQSIDWKNYGAAQFEQTVIPMFNAPVDIGTSLVREAAKSTPIP